MTIRDVTPQRAGETAEALDRLLVGEGLFEERGDASLLNELLDALRDAERRPPCPATTSSSPNPNS